MQNNHHQSTIMIVDEKPANLNRIVDILSTQGYKIRAFSNGKLALNSAAQNPPDLILLNINTPDLNGYEICLLLKSHPTLKNIPVIFISRLADTREKIRVFECGGADYITRPFQQEEIKARIKTHLSLAKTESMKQEIEKRIRREKQYYDQLDNLADAIIHINQMGKIVYCNPVVEQYFGYSRSELLGQPVEILVPQDYQQSHIHHREKYMQTPTTRPMSKVHNIFAKKKNGETFPVDICLSTLYSEEGLLITAEIRDVTEQLKLKKELETQRQFFDDALSKTAEGMFLTNKENLIIETNYTLTTMLGYQPAEFVGKHSGFLYENDDDFEKITSLNNSVDHTTTKQSVIVNCRCKDGTLLPTEVSMIPIQNNLDKENGDFFVIRDISERLQMEREHKSIVKQLMQAQKMEALGQLTGGVAHDFNNILASMMGFTELAIELLGERQDLYNPEIIRKFTDYLNEIHIAGDRAKVLIEQMLTFSRTRNNGPLQPFNISILVNEAIRMLRPVLPASISINAYVQDNISQVMADPVQVHQILMNICINARDAMDGKGRIDITLGETEISNGVCTSCQQPVNGYYLELAIKDSGPGIDPRVIERLFEPFFTTKKDGKGTGMGLAMAHGIIHHHQGHIIVESESRLGSKFRILFPIIQDKAEQQDNQAGIGDKKYVTA